MFLEIIILFNIIQVEKQIDPDYNFKSQYLTNIESITQIVKSLLRDAGVTTFILQQC